MKSLRIIIVCTLIALNADAAVLKQPPQKPDPKAHYIFYLHGRIIEEEGMRPKHPQYGFYEYEKILQTFEKRGFIVISEARPKGTDPAQYAPKVVNQIRALMSSRVPSSNLCVIGASKGALITMLISASMKQPDIRYVIMGACNESTEEEYHPELTGDVLSIYEESDRIGRTCKSIFGASPHLKKSAEQQLHLGLEHGFLYAPYKEWVDPAIAWCSGTAR